MKLYIECYYADGSQILGNMDGQAVLNVKRIQSYKRCKAYKFARQLVSQYDPNSDRLNCRKVAKIKVVTETRKELASVISGLIFGGGIHKRAFPFSTSSFTEIENHV